MPNDKFMRAALEEARIAALNGDTPIGAVITRENNIIARAHNQRMALLSAIAHAEITAIKSACETVGDWRLDDCDIYITIEPCPMCAGAIIQARILRVFFGAKNPKAGCAGSVIDLFAQNFNHKPIITGGILEEECADLIKKFFKELRA